MLLFNVQVWPTILLDRGVNVDTASDDITGRSAREAFLKEDLPNASCYTAKGEFIKPSRWFSWVKKFRVDDCQTGADLLGRVVVCMQQKWSASADDLFDAAPEAANLKTEGTSGSKAKDLASAKLSMAQLRKTTKNALHSAAMMLADPYFWFDVRILGLGSRAEHAALLILVLKLCVCVCCSCCWDCYFNC
jgi:hypothetical protein